MGPNNGSNNQALTTGGQKVKEFQQFFEARKGSLAAIMPKVLSPERVMKVALAAYARTPGLWNCTITSVYESIHQAVQLGLEPGSPLGHAYLVPYKGTCTLIVGYKGLIALARRSGEIATIEAHVVYEADTFEVRFGTEGCLKHVPNFDVANPGDPKLVYAIATLKDGTKQWEVMPLYEVNKIRERSPSAGSSHSPWKTDYAEMARKTVVRRLCKYLPMSIELADALDAEDRQEQQAIDISHLAAVDTTPGDGAPVDTAQLPADTGAQPATTQTQTQREKAEIRAPRGNGAPAEKRTPALKLSNNAEMLIRMAGEAKNSSDLESVQRMFEQYANSLGKDEGGHVEGAIDTAEQRLGL